MYTDSGRIRLIDIEAFLERELIMSKGELVPRRSRVLAICEAKITEYAILSHRWTDMEVDYEEMVDLPKMEEGERDEIRERLGYRKILDTCLLAKRDGYKWVWVDTCCMDKRSTGEQSEAINSMYRWYEGAGTCYAYLHDVLDSSLPTERDDQKYPMSNGWPVWFSRGWTLQEMIAPSNVQFFNKDWMAIGDKKTLARILAHITEVPEHILKDGLSGNRPCIAQIMSWAANRKTTRIEDRAYSLMGLLDMNMLAFYGEGKSAFHRLQLEIIRSSDDQSIFAWGWHGENVRTGSILADDPSFFEHCSEMELMGYDHFIESLKESFPKEEFPSIDKNHLGTSIIMNRGIQIWMFLRPYTGSETIFKAWLPCRNYSKGPPVTINMAVRNYNYLRYFLPLEELPTGQSLQFRQVYLRYHPDAFRDVTFDIDDSAITENGFTNCHTYPSDTGNTIMLTSTSPICTKSYVETAGGSRFSVAFGQFFGLDWVHLINRAPKRFSSLDEAKLLINGAKHAYSMAGVASRDDLCARIWICHIPLPRSTCTVRVSRIVWSRRIEVWMEIIRDSTFHLGEWRSIDVEVSGFSMWTRIITSFTHRKSMMARTDGLSCYTIHHVNLSICYW